jgi:hypothetical protein
MVQNMAYTTKPSLGSFIVVWLATKKNASNVDVVTYNLTRWHSELGGKVFLFYWWLWFCEEIC